MSNLSESKRLHLEHKQRRRDEENDSILDHFGGVIKEPIASKLEDAVVTIDDKPAPCVACSGKGWIKSLFSRWECSECYGTTYDLTNPITIIKWQKLCLEWAKTDAIQMRVELRNATTTREQRLEKEVDAFYQGSTRKD